MPTANRQLDALNLKTHKHTITLLLANELRNLLAKIDNSYQFLANKQVNLCKKQHTMPLDLHCMQDAK